MPLIVRRAATPRVARAPRNDGPVLGRLRENEAVRAGKLRLPTHLRTLTIRQQNQPLMVNALLSVVVYFV